MKTLLIPLMLAALFLSACGGNEVVTPTEGVLISDVYTAAAMTLTAQSSLVTPTMTPLPTTTPTISSSPTFISSTPTAQSVSVSYSTANGCYNAAYISDVTIPDGSILAPGEVFTKTWKFQNTGSCDWEADFEITFEIGENMNGDSVTIGESVAVGDTASISVSLVAPGTEGTYTGYWRLGTDSSMSFGQSVYVMIIVSDDAATSTPTPTVTATETSTLTITVEATATDTATPTNTFTPTPENETGESDDESN